MATACSRNSPRRARFADEMSGQGMKILTPALGGAVLVTILVVKFGAMSGIDLPGVRQP